MKKVILTLAFAGLCFFAVSCGNCCNKQQEAAAEEQTEETKAACDSTACPDCAQCDSTAVAE
ncbi:MAG: hypothetical protein J5871_00260 [Bacteroidales bacterium]|nr:hypothetical protein [Bacteroidales bacterium]